MANVLPQITKFKRIALDLLFPARCVGCGKEGDFICHYCRQSLQPITPPLCPRCGSPQSGGTHCPSCAGWQAEIDGIRSPFIFGGVIRQAIHELKYRNIKALTAPLAGLLRDYLIANPMPAEVLVPVPLHRKRLRERGYNQSGLLARQLGNLTNLQVVEDCLLRQHPAPPQARTASIIERQSNIAGAFSCRNSTLQGKQVLLIDDVATSGATLNACAGALKSAGAASVWGLVIAKEVREIQ